MRIHREKLGAGSRCGQTGQMEYHVDPIASFGQCLQVVQVSLDGCWAPVIGKKALGFLGVSDQAGNVLATSQQRFD